MIIKRGYAEKPPISYTNAKERVMLVLKLYDKIDPEKVLKASLSLDFKLFNALRRLIANQIPLTPHRTAHPGVALHERSGPGLVGSCGGDHGGRGRVLPRDSRRGRREAAETDRHRRVPGDQGGVLQGVRALARSLRAGMIAMLRIAR